MKQQAQETKGRFDQLKPQKPMRRLGEKETRQVAGGPIPCPTLDPKK
jgi:hypothetical protein